MRKTLNAALALTLVGGVYLSAGVADASNMGFKLERTFRYADNLPNTHLVSFPLFNGTGDIANLDVANPGPFCQSQDPATFVPDGRITMEDLLCEVWSDLPTLGDGSSAALTYVKVDEGAGNCGFLGPVLTIDSFFGGWSGVTNIAVTELTNRDDLTADGDLDSDGSLDPDKVGSDTGFRLELLNQTAGSDNRAVIVGSHNPVWNQMSGTALPAGSLCQRVIVNLPYHAMYQDSTQALCGLPDVDWVDELDNLSGAPGADGFPDSCDNGIYDPASGATVNFNTIVDDVVGSGGGINGANISANPFNPTGPPLFGGTPFPLKPGEGYFVEVTRDGGYAGADWVPPHF